MKHLAAFIICIFFATCFNLQAQTIKRETIGSAGNVIFADKTLVRQTIGQPYSTTAYYGDEFGCRPGFQQPITFSLEIIRDDLSINVYPNPTTYSVTIESTDTISNASLQISDINGKLMLTQTIEEFKSYLITCETWLDGVYFIALYDERDKNNSCVSKLIVTKN